MSKSLTCDASQSEFNGSCYIFSQETSDFYSAQASCDELGMHVVNIESQDEQDFLEGKIEASGDRDRDYWIGLSAVTWLDGTRLTYDNFGSGRAFNDGAHCFRIYPDRPRPSMDFKWYDDECFETRYFICEIEGACGGLNSVVSHNGSCYNFSTSKSNFSSSNSACKEKDMHLVFIGTESEQDFIAEEISKRQFKQYWIGLTSAGWNEDGSGLPYSKFAGSGSFDNGKICYRMDSGQSFQWLDRACNYEYYHICESEDGEEATEAHTEYSVTTKTVTTHDISLPRTQASSATLQQGQKSTEAPTDFSVTTKTVTTQETSLSRTRVSGVSSYQGQKSTEAPTEFSVTTKTVTTQETSLSRTRVSGVSSYQGQKSTEAPTEFSVTTKTVTTQEISLPRTQASDVSAHQDPISSVIPAVISVAVVFLLTIVIGVICYKRRLQSKSAIRDTLRDPAHVLNPAFTAPDVDKNDYTGLLKPIEGASNAAMPVSSAEGQQSHQYTELPSSVQPAKIGENCIYNEVDEQDYNVLFGGKEQGDYHEYNMPESTRTTRNTTYQDLLKDRISGIATSPSGNVLNGVGHKSGEDKDKVLRPRNKEGPTETDSNQYEDLRQGSSDYTSLIRDGKPTSPVSKNISPIVNQISQDQDGDYSELRSVVPPVNNGGIYNEVGEQDYNMLFGGKEHGDYHEYNLPGCAEKSPNAAYQDLLTSGMQGGVSNPKAMDFHGQNKNRVRTETDNEGYQDLRKNDDNYKSLHPGSDTPSKPKQSTSVAEIDSSYQALQTSDPEYACLEPNVDDQSSTNPKPGSVKNHEYQTLEKLPSTSDYTPDRSDDTSPEYAVLEPADIDESTESTNDRENGQEHSYESLQRSQENPGALKGVTSDYEDPIQVIPEKPYDNLQRKQWSKPLHPHPMVENANDTGDYEEPRPAIEDSANAYQTLDNLGSQGHVQTNEDSDYSHLQRNPRETTSKDFISAMDSSNPYGKLNAKS
ncbi:uncharacterized protein LOC129280358 [Lytechinus pictus]|uniref:uncharacterized protein LOC129280358 n=1 Tax=Lytechinus pictus TaxID=7653 RepID=UPI0030B9F384